MFFQLFLIAFFSLFDSQNITRSHWRKTKEQSAERMAHGKANSQ
jgi:hypothetical protein